MNNSRLAPCVFALYKSNQLCYRTAYGYGEPVTSAADVSSDENVLGVLAAKLGFRAGDVGTLTSRTIMLAELRTVLDAVRVASREGDARQE